MHDGCDRRKQAVKMADVFGIEKVWGSIYENNREHGDFATRRSNFNMTVFGEGYSTVMRDEELSEKKWWREHSTPEFGSKIVAGTMKRMHKCAKLKGMPVCSYYTVG